MTRNDFLKLQEEDIQTSSNDVFKAILEGFKEYISIRANIDENKSIEGMYDYMRSYARKNQTGGCFCIDPFNGFKKLMFEYLEIKEDKDVERIDVSLEDIFI